MKNNYPLILSATIAILIMILLSSCGTRKTEVVKTENVKSNISIENTYSTGSKIVLGKRRKAEAKLYFFGT